MKVEVGVQLMKDGLAWGETWNDAYLTSYGWIDPADAPIHDPRYCKLPTDVVYEGSHYTAELRKGTLIRVRRTTIVEQLEDQMTKEDWLMFLKVSVLLSLVGLALAIPMYKILY